MLAYQPTHGKNQSELEKSLSWRFGHQRSETFSRVAELRYHLKRSSLSGRTEHMYLAFLSFFGITKGLCLPMSAIIPICMQ